MNVRNGCDHLLREARVLAGRRWALLGHGASVASGLRPLHLALAESKAGAPAALFGPEHGYYGVEQDMVASADATDPWTGAPILSLYGDDPASLRPSPLAFGGLDVLLVDLQDVGSRYYTYAATAVWATEAALAAGCEVHVLDRPNPLGGVLVEGNAVGEGFESFVGAFHIPVRHGLTLAEILLHQLRDADTSDLHVWAMDGWRRGSPWNRAGLPWIAPSPNMPTLATALVYPGGCLVEATELSEGRGTTRPFQLVGAPGVDPPAVAAALEQRELSGVRFLPTYFKPQFQKHAGEVCGGVEVVVTRAQAFAPYRTGCEIVAAFYRHRPRGGYRFEWREAPYEFVSEVPAIDLLTGSAAYREILESGGDLEDFYATWKSDEEAFDDERRDVLLYLDP
jgi:uncharacterized protein YbbC (DUF1343 family)